MYYTLFLKNKKEKDNVFYTLKEIYIFFRKHLETAILGLLITNFFFLKQHCLVPYSAKARKNLFFSVQIIALLTEENLIILFIKKGRIYTILQREMLINTLQLFTFTDLNFHFLISTL